MQLADVALELLPLAGELVGVLGVAFDQVADREDELGLEQVDLLDGAGEDAGPMAAGAVADDDELELAGVVVDPQVGPGIAILHGDEKVAEGRQPGVAGQDAPRRSAGKQRWRPGRDVSWRGPSIVATPLHLRGHCVLRGECYFFHRRLRRGRRETRISNYVIPALGGSHAKSG